MNIGYKSHSEIQLERFYHKHESAHLDGNQYEEFGRNLIEHVLRVERVKAEIPNNTPWRKRLLFNISTLQMLCMWTPPREDLRITKEALKLNEEGNTDKANEILRKFISEYEKSISKTQTELGNIKKRKHPVIEIVETIYGENNNIMGKHIEGAIKDPRWKEMITIYGETIYPVDKRFGSRSLSGLPSLLSRVANKK